MGIWQTRAEDIERVVSEYFAHIFHSTSPAESEIDEVLECLSPRVSSVANQMLSTPFTSLEFGSVIPSRGLRQGDPLSPYLFICCAEVLISMVERAVERSELNGVKVAPTTPTISNLCFADDTLLFSRATEEDARTLKSILDTYAKVSGQEINLEKTTMCFGPATSIECKENIRDILGFQIVDQHDRYLGMPGSVGRSRKELFSFLRDRLWGRIKGWGDKHLSKAGKEVLIKSVLQAIPAYMMSCFILPNGLIKELESAIKRFWWGSSSGRKIAWVSWSKLCVPKKEGGMGFRDLRSFNLALLAKQLWRVLVFPDLLFSQIIKARYFPDGDIFGAVAGVRPSATWQSLLKARTSLSMGLRRRIGDGKTTSIWADPWLMDEGSVKVFTRRPINTSQPNCVADLIDRETGSWNTSLIEDIFWPIDCGRIYAVPIGSSLSHDRWVWRFTRNGHFSVCSCYYSTMKRLFGGNNEVESSSGNQDRRWSHVWNLRVPPKTCHFLWRACKETLPTAAELFRRKIIPDPICSRCGSSTETLLHVVQECKGMGRVWEEGPFWLQGMGACSTMWQWLDRLRNSLEEDEIQLAIVVAWKSWDNRNKELHEEEGIPTADMLSWCSQYLYYYRTAQLPPASGMKISHSQTWTPPPDGIIKVNFDVSLPPNRDFYVVAAVGRDQGGRCKWWSVQSFKGRPRSIQGRS